MTAAQAPEGQPAPPEQPMALKRLHGIRRTRRVVPARGGAPGPGQLVETDRPDRDPGGATPPADLSVAVAVAVVVVSCHDLLAGGGPLIAGVSLADSRAAITMACSSLHGSAAAAGAAPIR